MRGLPHACFANLMPIQIEEETLKAAFYHGGIVTVTVSFASVFVNVYGAPVTGMYVSYHFLF